MNNKTKVRFCGMVLLTLFGCKQKSYVSTAGFILGPESEIQRLDESKSSPGVKDVAHASVLISTKLDEDKRKFCSGTLIEASADQKERLRVLTNFHCFAKTNDRGEVIPEFLEEACQQTSVYLDFTYDNAAHAEEVPCMLNSLSGDFTGDIAVFTLSKPIDDSYKPLSFWTDDSRAADRDALIIHHPDVKSNYVRVGSSGTQLPAASITDTNCKTLPPFTTDEWHLDHTLPYSIPHTCDLIHGSSGSALIDKETGQVLGVNWGGIEIKFKTKSETYNAATRATYVQAFLNGELEKIQQETQANGTANDKNKTANKNQLTDGAISKTVCGSIGAKVNDLPMMQALFYFFVLLVPLAVPRMVSRSTHRNGN